MSSFSRAWRALHETQLAGGPPFYTALKARVEHLDWTSTDLAEHLTQSLGHSDVPSEAALRKLIQRSREAFADHLLSQLQLALGQSTWEQVEEELIALELLPYCEHALNARRRVPVVRPSSPTDGSA